MTKLQVEIRKAQNQITKFVSKHLDCDNVTIELSNDRFHVYVWLSREIVFSVQVYKQVTVKQMKNIIINKLKQGSTTQSEDYPF